jgi:hypothetical protein
MFPEGSPLRLMGEGNSRELAGLRISIWKLVTPAALNSSSTRKAIPLSR